MSKYEVGYEGNDGWTPWIIPLPGYKIACCDCGLVHRFEFRVKDDGIQIRAKRDNRATAAKRRKPQKMK